MTFELKLLTINKTYQLRTCTHETTDHEIQLQARLIISPNIPALPAWPGMFTDIHMYMCMCNSIHSMRQLTNSLAGT